MISSLRGKLIYKNNNEIILDVNGVGYRVLISKKVSEKITELNSEYTVITFLDVKRIHFNYSDLLMRRKEKCTGCLFQLVA